MKFKIKIPEDKNHKLYPNRYNEIHKVCCKLCPSGDGMRNDPEVEEQLKLPKEKRVKCVFLCGWRQSKLCKGFCDTMGLDEDYIKSNDL
tara:strand:- start:15 stop:281 length:267 start_codon:yes stop_codon:yes gene_type:complete